MSGKSKNIWGKIKPRIEKEKVQGVINSPCWEETKIAAIKSAIRREKISGSGFECFKSSFNMELESYT